MRDLNLFQSFGRTFLVVVSMCFMNLNVFAQRENWEKANQFYQNNEFDSALLYYHQLELQYPDAPDLYYNLGATYYKLQEWSKSILYYQKARHFNPQSEIIKENLLLANAHIEHPLVSAKPIFFITWWNQIIRVFSPFTGAVISLVIFAIILIFSYLQLTQRIDVIHFKRWLSFGVILLLGSFILLLSSYQMQSKNNLAVVMTGPIPLFENKDDLESRIINIPEGTLVKIKKEEDNHIFVVLPNSASGWISNSAVERVIPN